MIIAGYANRSYYGYTFLRGKYVEAARSVALVIEEARQAGLLGSDIGGSGYQCRSMECWPTLTMSRVPLKPAFNT